MILHRALLLTTLILGCTKAQPTPAEKKTSSDGPIANGTTSWFDSMPNDPLLNAKVDIGTIHSVGTDEIEAVIQWPSTFGSLQAWRHTHPDLPDGTVSRDRERMLCRPEGPLYYRIESRYIAPDGKEVARDTFDPAEKRAAAEAESKGRRSPMPFGSDSRSLSCLAAASKCRGEPLVWPPPPNNTPLEYSDRATKMRLEYNAPFVPSCKLQ